MKTINLLSLSIAAILITACSDDDCPLKNDNSGASDQKSITVVINLANRAANRATEQGSTEENELKKLEFFVFDAEGNKDAICGYYEVSGTDVTRTTKLQISSSGPGVRFVVAANAPVSIGVQATYADLQAVLATGEYEISDTPTDIPAIGFEMAGSVTANINVDEENVLAMEIDRLVSKFEEPGFAATGLLQIPAVDLVELWGEGTTIDNSQMTFTYSGYVLANGINKSRLIHAEWASTWDYTAWAAWSDGKTNLNSVFRSNGSYYENYSGSNADEWFIKDKAVYAYENAPKPIILNVGAGYDATTVYAIVIKGELSVTGSTETRTRYWRINVNKDYDYKIDRNNVYKVTVNAIKSTGFASPEDAETNDDIVPVLGGASVDVTVVVSNWNVIDIQEEM